MVLLFKGVNPENQYLSLANAVGNGMARTCPERLVGFGGLVGLESCCVVCVPLRSGLRRAVAGRSR
mgnify:CR=1 FL=1